MELDTVLDLHQHLLFFLLEILQHLIMLFDNILEACVSRISRYRIGQAFLLSNVPQDLCLTHLLRMLLEIVGEKVG